MFARSSTQAPLATHGQAAVRFSRVFPLGQLVLCAILLWPIRGRIFAGFFLPLRVIRPPIVFRNDNPVAQRVREWAMNNSLDIVALLNAPAGMLQLPYAIFSTDHRELAPSRVDIKVWRAVTWPIQGTIFWWIAGRGAEALAASRRKVLVPRIRWIEAVVGFVLLGLGIAYVVAFVFFAGPDRHDLILQLLAVFMTLWAFLGGLSVAGKIAQWRLRKRLGAEGST